MTGLLFDFESNDIVLNSTGSLSTAEISSQCCALIAVSELCRLTAPHVGERLVSKLFNRRRPRVRQDIASAIRAVERDGGKNVDIRINETIVGNPDINDPLQFFAEYGDD